MKAGSKLKSAVCATEAMVVKAGKGTVECGGKPMLTDKPADLGEIDPGFAGGSQIGKRYIDSTGTWELLCIKPGKGSLSVNGAALSLKDAKPLPASD